MSYAETMGRGSIVVFSLSIAGVVLGYGFRIFLSHALGIEDFGLFYAILAFVGIFGIFKELGLGTAAATFLAGTTRRARIGEIVSTSVVMQVALAAAISLALFVASDWIVASYFKTADALVPFYLILVSAVAGTLMASLQTAHQGMSKFGSYALTEPLRMVVVFVATLALLGFGIAGVAAAYVVAALITSAYLAITLRARLGTRPRPALARKLLAFGLPVFIGSIGGVVLSYTDTIMLTYFSGLAQVGLYQVAMPTSQLLWFFVSGLAVIVLPVAAGLWVRHDTRRIGQLGSLLIKFSFAFIIPAAIVLAIFADSILLIPFGEPFVAATTPLRILAIGAIFYTPFVLANTILVAIRQHVTVTKITIAIAGINFLLNLALIPAYGITAAAASTSLAYAIGAMLSIAALRRRIPLTLGTATIALMLLGGVLAAGAVLMLTDILVLNVIIESVIAVAVLCIVFFVYLFTTRCVSPDELVVLQQAQLPIPNWVVTAGRKLAS